jgi:hypothetical protein
MGHIGRDCCKIKEGCIKTKTPPPEVSSGGGGYESFEDSLICFMPGISYSPLISKSISTFTSLWSLMIAL